MTSTPLTPTRLFADPPLLPALPQQARFGPTHTTEGKAAGSSEHTAKNAAEEYVVYLQSSADDREQLELWRCDLDSPEPYRWLAAEQLRDIAQGPGAETEAERAERERKRQFSSGITSYQISANGARLLVPYEGRGYVFQIAPSLGAAIYTTPTGLRQTDMHLSPTGQYLSLVRAGDLYIVDLTRKTEQRLTQDGSDTISSGTADFIAAEEMHRFTGHWWSPDESSVAFQRTDSTPVALTYRYDIQAAQIDLIPQRYPYTGEANANVTLGVYQLKSKATTWLDYSTDPEAYLARVDWFDDKLCIQVQSRNQQHLELQYWLASEDRWQSLLTETSNTWIELHDNFTPTSDPENPGFLWTSERTGTSQLYFYPMAADQVAPDDPIPLTQQGQVNNTVKVGNGNLWFTGWDTNPTEQHLYRVALDGSSAVEQLTELAGWHDAKVSPSGDRLLDQFSCLDQPAKLALVELGTAKSWTIAGGATSDSAPYHQYANEHCASELGELQAADGQILHYRLTRPQTLSAQGAPLIVHVYGGPGVQRVKNEWPPLSNQLFTQAGFGILELDNRGSSNRGAQFSAPIYRQLGVVEVQDQLVGAHFAQSLDWVDANRIGVYGHSYGGYMTLMCLAQAPQVFKAGASIAPVADWSLYDTHYTERYLDTPSANPNGYASSGVIAHLDKLVGKLLLIHGMADDNVLFSNTTLLMHELQSRGTPFELMTYPGAKHALQETTVATHRFELIVDFFKRNL